MKLPGLPNKDGGSSTELEAPDGGWGWMVVIGTAVLFHRYKNSKKDGAFKTADFLCNFEILVVDNQKHSEWILESVITSGHILDLAYCVGKWMVTLTPDSCFGLIFGDFLVEVGAGTAFVTTGVSVCIGSAAALGLVMNYALNTFSCRQVGVTGAIIYFCGSFLTAFVTNVYQIIFTYGILQGIGLGLMVPATFTSFNHYFVRRRTFAMAVAQLIIGVAAMVIPLVIQLLLEEYGFRGTQAIIAAFTLHALLGMVVQQPVRYHMKRKKKVERTGSDKVDTAMCTDEDHKHARASELNIQIENVNIKIHKHDTELATIRRTSQDLINIQFQKVDSKDARISVGVVNEVEDNETSVDDKEVVVSSTTNAPDEHKFLVHSGHSKKYVTAEIGITVKGNGSTSSINKIRRMSDAESQDGCDRCWTAVVDFLDLKLLLDPVYVNISIGVSISLICMLQFFAFYPILVLDLGYSKSDTAIFIAVCNALDLMGRVVIALIGIFSPRFSSRALFLTGTLITVAGRLLLILFNDFLAMALMTGCLGFARSFLQVPLPLIFAEYNLERFPSAFGLYSVMFGLIALMVGPFTGLVRDLTDSYAMCINTLNGLAFFGCILPWIAEHAVTHVRTKSN